MPGPPGRTARRIPGFPSLLSWCAGQNHLGLGDPTRRRRVADASGGAVAEPSALFSEEGPRGTRLADRRAVPSLPASTAPRAQRSPPMAMALAVTAQEPEPEVLQVRIWKNPEGKPVFEQELGSSPDFTFDVATRTASIAAFGVFDLIFVTDFDLADPAIEWKGSKPGNFTSTQAVKTFTVTVEVTAETGQQKASFFILTLDDGFRKLIRFGRFDPTIVVDPH